MTEQPSAGSVTLAEARNQHATPTPEPGQLWRVRWNDQAGVVLVLTVADDHMRVAPVSLDELPDETAADAPASTNTLGLPLAIWSSDAAAIPARVLDYKLGELDATPASLPRGSVNWGPTDPRTLVRARLQDLIETLEEAQWAPSATTVLDLGSVLRGADLRAIQDVLGETSRVAALRRGQVDLTTDEAERLSRLLNVPAADLLATVRPPLPDALVAEMDLPAVRSLVDRLAERRDTNEAETWRSAAYGVWALAARDHDRRDTRWEGRIRAYFEAQLRETPTDPDQ